MTATKKDLSFFYLIIGSGRVARHFIHYFHNLQLQCDHWDRKQSLADLEFKLSRATHVLLAISDDALESFFNKHLKGLNKMVVHFSGATHVEGLPSAHPLMTFSENVYQLDFYKKIHFVVTEANSLQDLLPGLSNPSTRIEIKDKALYHALCVLGGNFVNLLSLKMLSGLKTLGVPKEAAQIYLEKVLENTLEQPEGSSTGPLIRKDKQTVQKNLAALAADPSFEIYKAFISAYWPDYPKK